MRCSLPVLLLILLSAGASVAIGDPLDGWTIVENGLARSAIVLADPANAFSRLAAEELQGPIERASGVKLPILSPPEAEALPQQTVRLVIGPGPLAEKLGIDAEKLPPQAYRIKTVGNAIVLAGHDLGEYGPNKPISRHASPATLYAVSHLLDHELGVRWLWPGEVGTYVPARRTIVIRPLDVSGQPQPARRDFSVSLNKYTGKGSASRLPAEIVQKMLNETMRWWARHHLGGESPLRFGHSFTAWWDKYYAAHPDYFAHPPEGEKQGKPDRVKLCQGNPAVVEQILAEWKAAGMPDAWNICPNDSRGFCTCPRCRAMDGPELAAATPQEIWHGDVDLSRRHLTFCNIVLRAMKALRPNVTLCSYAYSSYRNLPENCAVEPGLALEFVGSYTQRDQWQRWADAGVHLGLRPNWLHSGAIAPYLPLRQMGEFYHYAYGHGMLIFHYDALLGYWGTQGPNYYLLARLASRPDLSVDQVIEEYVSAFGPAAPAIRRYLEYWIRYTDRVGMVVNAGGSVSVDAERLYETICKEHDIPTSALVGSWRVLPYLYGDDVLKPAESLLDEAQRLAAGDATVAARIQFLRDGLQHLRLTRNEIELAYQSKRPDAATQAELIQRVAELHALRDAISPRHVVWGDVVTGVMQDRGIAPEFTKKRKKAETDVTY
jgi:hypothetical protein